MRISGDELHYVVELGSSRHPTLTEHLVATLHRQK